MGENAKNSVISKKDLGPSDLDAFVLNPTVDKENLKIVYLAGGQGGGKIASEFCRLGYPVLAYNTSKEDLIDLEKTINHLPKKTRGEFKPIYLKGEGGASKDRDLGYQAIKDNLEVLQTALVDDSTIVDADFVWLVVSLGGGTGNGSIGLITRILGLIREDKKIYRGGIYKPTFGIIAAVPDSRVTKSKIAANVALALAEMDELHSRNELGAVILVDNGKLVDDFNEEYKNKTTSKTWASDGNAKIARIVTELALSTSLPGSEVFDKTEMLDIWSAPGYLNIGKKVIEKDWINNYISNIEDEEIKLLDKKNLDENQISQESKKEIFKKFVQETFEDNIFVSGIELKEAIHGGMIVITDGNVIDTKDSTLLYNVMNKDILYGEAIEATHYGFIKNRRFLGSVKHPKDKQPDGRLFTLCVTYTPPEYMINWLDIAQTMLDKSKSKIEELTKKRSELVNRIGKLNGNSILEVESAITLSEEFSKFVKEDRGVKKNTVGEKNKEKKLSLVEMLGVVDEDVSTHKSKEQIAEEIKKQFKRN